MPSNNSRENDFLLRINEIIEKNISNEQFGVSELADRIGMSRSNLLRKIKKHTDLSASQYIRNQRLKKAKELLSDDSFTVSEISYRVGFGSPSYFIKCFGEYYGYPPGETGKMATVNLNKSDFGELEQNHQLAAIMFTDIEGYTALMQQNEKKAIALRNRHREVFNSVTKKYKGNILQYFGDGTLSTFNSAIDAVRCGIELQLAFNSFPQIPVRIGIHSGDIIFNDEGIIGDGVNIASRVESLALSGSVYISEKVYDEVKNQSGINCISLGEYELKNVDKPLEVYAVCNPGLTVPQNKFESGKETSKAKKINKILWGVLLLVIVALLVYVFVGPSQMPSGKKEKSIAVLPFINDSNDSTNVYFVNGLMEAILGNLQNIEDLRVISRTSVEKYRNNPKSMKEIAKDLNVSYILEGSGQKIGDEVLLNIQLIEADSENNIWFEQFNRKFSNVFALQAEIAKNVADKIEVSVTPKEIENIEKASTKNMVAYEYFLKGLDLLNYPTPENLKACIPWFHKAISEDNKYARAYAAVAISYFSQDEGLQFKQYTDSINYYADKALLYDSDMPQSQVAKGLFYMSTEQYKLAESFFEKALHLRPNYDLALVFLVKLYSAYMPDTEKYLNYALFGKKMDIASLDSATTSISYLHLSNAFIQSGFQEEAEQYINMSLEYDNANLYSQYVKAYISYARERDLNQLSEELLEVFGKDTTRLDILQEVGKAFYYKKDYKRAYIYYKPFMEVKKMYNLNIYNSENIKIARVFREVGQMAEAQKLLEEFKAFALKSTSDYKNIHLTYYYAEIGETEKALEHFALFSQQEKIPIWTILFTPIEPVLEDLIATAEFKNSMFTIEANFRKYHQRVKEDLNRKGLL